jgi:hypothetical protein
MVLTNSQSYQMLTAFNEAAVAIHKAGVRCFGSTSAINVDGVMIFMAVSTLAHPTEDMLWKRHWTRFE